jgi:predicted nucleotidyltransferase
MDLLVEIVEILVQRHGCHTVILYGSRSRGEENSASDYDLMGVKDSGAIVRDARLWKNVYLDLFVFPEEKILNPDASLLYMSGGKVLLEKGSLGTDFLKKLKEIEEKGPKELAPDEIAALEVWAEKSLQRIETGGREGLFRKFEFIPAVLEHYFTTRGMWYRGPKASFHWLKENNPELLEAFDSAMIEGAPLSALKLLVKKLKNH